MSEPLKAIRGMHDVLPDQSGTWQVLERCLRELMHSYGYQEIRMPVVEATELFKRSIGEVTDIVEKEMYTFADRNGDSLTLRPEGTAGCVRACLEHGLIHQEQVARLWYMGPMFRHERPQRGRQRQFYQFGVEVFHIAEPTIEVELIALTARLWKCLGLDQQLTLQLNSLGDKTCRDAHREALQQYFDSHEDKLDEASKQRLEKNPLRLLDSKAPNLQNLIQEAPRLLDYLSPASDEHFKKVCHLLDVMKISYEINPHLVRGLDYYTDTVFEWVTDQLGAQGTVCAGGRYNQLVERLGGKPTPAVGFAMGLERVLELQQLLENSQEQKASNVDIYFILSESTQQAGLQLAESLRDAFKKLIIVTHLTGGRFKSQFKKADKSGARYAFILGEDECACQQITIKSLRESMPQQTVAWKDLIDYVRKTI